MGRFVRLPLGSRHFYDRILFSCRLTFFQCSYIGRQTRFQKPAHLKGPKTTTGSKESVEKVTNTSTSTILKTSTDVTESSRTSRPEETRQCAPWRRRESSSPPTERVPMVDEVPWRKRSRSEDRRPHRVPAPTEKKEEPVKMAPAWKSGVDMLRKPSPHRQSSVVDTVPPMVDVPWKSGAQLLRKTSRENSPARTALPEAAPDANVPWKSGAQMLKKTSRESSPVRTVPDTSVPWKSLKLRKTGSREPSPEKQSSTQLLEPVEWKGGVQVLRKRSVTPVRPQTTPETEQAPEIEAQKKESAKNLLTSKLSSVMKDSDAVPHKEMVKLKPVPAKVVAKDEPAPKVELKPTPTKPKPEVKENVLPVLKKVPPQTKDVPEMKEDVSLKPINRRDKSVERKPEIALKPVQKQQPEVEPTIKIELKKTPQKPPKETVPEAIHKVELKPVPPKPKPEVPEKPEIHLKKVPRKTEIPDSPKTPKEPIEEALPAPEVLPSDLKIRDDLKDWQEWNEARGVRRDLFDATMLKMTKEIEVQEEQKRLEAEEIVDVPDLKSILPIDKIDIVDDQKAWEEWKEAREGRRDLFDAKMLKMTKEIEVQEEQRRLEQEEIVDVPDLKSILPISKIEIGDDQKAWEEYKEAREVRRDLFDETVLRISKEIESEEEQRRTEVDIPEIKAILPSSNIEIKDDSKDWEEWKQAKGRRRDIFDKTMSRMAKDIETEEEQRLLQMESDVPEIKALLPSTNIEIPDDSKGWEEWKQARGVRREVFDETLMRISKEIESLEEQRRLLQEVDETEVPESIVQSLLPISKIEVQDDHKEWEDWKEARGVRREIFDDTVLKISKEIETLEERRRLLLEQVKPTEDESGKEQTSIKPILSKLVAEKPVIKTREPPETKNEGLKLKDIKTVPESTKPVDVTSVESSAAKIHLKRTPQKPRASEKTDSTTVDLKKASVELKKTVVHKKEEFKEQLPEVKLVPVQKPKETQTEKVEKHIPQAEKTSKTTVEYHKSEEASKPVESLPIEQQPESVIPPWRKKQTASVKTEPSVEAVASHHEPVVADVEVSTETEVHLPEKPKLNKKPTLPRKEPEEFKVPEVVLKRTPQKTKPDEPLPEDVLLKKVPPKAPEDVHKESISLKPIPKKKEVEEVKLPEVVLKPIPQKPKPEEPVSESIQLKKIPVQEPKDNTDDRVSLKPIPQRKEPEEVKVPEVKPTPEQETAVELPEKVPLEPERKETKVKPKRTKVEIIQPTPSLPHEAKETLATAPQQPATYPIVVDAKPKVPWRKKPQVPENVEQVDIVRPVEPVPETPSPNIPTVGKETMLKPVEESKPLTKKEVPEEVKLKPVPPKLPKAEPEVVPEVVLKRTPQKPKADEVETAGIELKKVPSKPKEVPKIPEAAPLVPAHSREPESVPAQQVQLKRTPQKPKVDEPAEIEIVKLKKVVPEIPTPETVPQSKPTVLPKKTKAVFVPSVQEQPADISENKVDLIVEEKKIEPKETSEVKVDVSPSWRKPRTPTVTPEVPVSTPEPIQAPVAEVSTEQVPIQPEEQIKESTIQVEVHPEPVMAPSVPEIPDDKPSVTSSATTTLKRTHRKHLPEIAPEPQPELAPVPATPEEPSTVTTSATSIQLKRTETSTTTTSGTSEIKTEVVEAKIPVEDQPVTISTKKVSKTVIQKTEIVQPESPEEKIRRSKVKASLTVAPKCQPPVFTKKLQPLSSRTGKKVRLHCQFQGEPEPTITWYRNENVLLPTADRLDITIEPGSSVLEISQVVLEDTGMYTCRAVNEAGSAITSANFIVQAKDDGGEPPRFVLPLSSIRASDGEPTKLICTLTGKPIPQISWYCGQREIRESRDFKPHFEPSTGTASLTIAEVYPDDEGIYRCRATNKHGTAECEASLTVGDMIVVSHQELVRAPVIAQPLEPDRIEPGSRKVMTVRFDGYPTPEVKWYHNGREIQQTENRLVTTFKNESTLVIVRCDANDTGKYEARAMNEGGEARTAASIQLQAPEEKKAPLQPPKFCKALRPQIVPEGEATVLEVEVQSAPECVFVWKQHGTVIQNSATVQIANQNNKSTLFIPESFVEHSGIYTVKAENPAGSVASTAMLTVERQLLAEEFVPPTVVRELTQTKVMDGEEVRLTCQVSGTPMPRIKWYHNGEPVREHNGVFMSLSPQGEAVLRLTEVFPEDAGLYECKAVNRAGQIITSTTLHVERYEYIPDSESASITAGPSVGTWEDLTGPSGSEDDLLSDKPVVKRMVKTKSDIKKTSKFQPQDSKDDELVQDSGAAPRFVVPLPQQIDVKDGQQARFEVKVESYPKATVFWYLNGKEILPSKEFGIDNLEDGTSILTLSEVYPDDAGELMCEAHNDKGVVTSIVQLNITDYKDTPVYRKPEWVTRMEAIRAQMLETHQPPQFTTEIVDQRVQEGESATFECYFAGNPKPDICWYYNGKLVKSHPNIKIRLLDDRTSLTLTDLEQEMAGEYVCKATSNAGAHQTKAFLHVHELSGDAREEYVARKEKERQEKRRLEKEKDDKKKKKGGKLTKEEYLQQAAKEKEAKLAEEAKKLAAIEEAKLAKLEAEKQPKKEVKVKKAKQRQELIVEEGMKKFVATQAIGLRALLEMTSRESLSVTEVVAHDKAQEFLPDQAPFQEFVQIENMLKSGVTVDQIVTLGAIGNLPVLTAPETQKALVRLVEDQGFRAVVLQAIVKEAARLAPEEPIGVKAVLKAIETKSANMEDIVVMAAHPEEFNIEAVPVPEMATVSTLLNEGISCEEMLTIVKAGELPALKLPESQWALVQIMEKLGQTPIISQIIVEEPALNLPAQINEIPQTVEERIDKFVTEQAIGLRALIQLAVQESVNVSEMATLDRAQEFQQGQEPFQEFLKVDTLLKSGVSVDQIVTLGSTGNLPMLTAPETQSALVRIVEDHGCRAITREVIVKEAAKLVPEEPIGLKAVLKAVETKTANIKDIVEMAMHPQEFDLSAKPVPELASVSTLLHEGVSCEEMLTIVKAGELPALKLPETQWPLIQIMDRLGQTAIVSQVIVEEPTLGLKVELPEMAMSTETTTDELSTATVKTTKAMGLPASQTLADEESGVLNAGVPAGVRPVASTVDSLKKATISALDVRADSAPEFDVKIKDLEIKERQPATFTVEVSDETANVTWHKDGEPVDVANTERFELVTDGRKRSLTIRSVSLLDEGEYTCSLGEQECTAELVVIELPPEITLRLKDVTVKRGEEASFEIELTKGDAKIQWIRNGSEVQLSQHIQLAIDGKRQRLVIYDCGPEDDCEYACVIGDQKSAARLTVLKPEVDFVAKLPQVLVAPMGQDVTFNIQLTKDTGEVTWLKNGEVVVDSEKIKIGKDGCNRMLTIVKAAIVDSAEYTCVLEAMKTSTMLTVEVPKVPPTIATDQVKTEVWVKRGEDAIIEVPFNGFPTPKAEWTFKGKTIRKTKRSVAAITETSATLTLKAVEENEAGQYTCKLINECGDVSVSATVKIVEKPSNPSAPECLETADDSITIMWKPPAFNGGSVITNYIIEYQEKTTKKWTVANKDVVVVETTYMVTKLTTNVEYRFRVTAVNTAGPGTPSSESCLFKAAKAAIPEAPSIKEPLKDCTAGLKETATLTCLIVGVPTPTLRWFKDDDEFTPKSSSYDKGQARLVLANTNEEAAGRYMCVASNDSGSCETSCTLVIQEAPKIVPEKKAKVYKTQVEKNWSISAKVTGLPRPEVTWTKNGASIEGNTHYISVVETQSSTACSTTLTIINTERTDTAKYTLTATNVAGTVTHDITLKISDKPSKPQGPFEPKEIDKTSVKMEWKPPLDDGGIELKGYNVEYSEIFKEQWKKVEEVSTQTICHIKNLTEGLEYVFRVNATNDVGTSDFLVSEPVLVRSQFDVPSAPRGPLDVSGMTDTTLVLTWLAPTSDGGSPLTEYLVERREVSKKAWQKVGSTDGKTLNIEATGLKKGTSYNFRITAQNELGYGPPFSPEDVIIAGKKLTPPSPPTNLTVADITSRSVTLQWAPPASSGGAELTGYIVEKMLDGTDKWEKMVTLDPSVTVHCLQNLKEKSEFFFRVLSENPMGLSAPAETEKVSLKTHATPPSPPTSPLEVRPVGPNSIMVEWGIPDSDGGAAIEGYIVAVRDSRKTMWMEVGQVDADTTRLIVKDMQEGHKYYVRVFARNEVGLSDPLETEEPVKVVRPPDYLEPGVAGPAHKDPTASLSLSTETLSSWMREANVDADIRFYSRSSLLRRDEYFFRVWYYSRQLFK